MIIFGGFIYLIGYSYYLIKSSEYVYHPEDIDYAYVMIYPKDGEPISKEIYYYNLSPRWINIIGGYSPVISLLIIFISTGIMEKNKLKRYLIDFNIASCILLLIITYVSNWLYGELIETLNILYYILITTAICIIYYLYKLLLSRH